MSEDVEQYTGVDGHEYVTLIDKQGEPCVRRVCDLVLEAFNGPCPQGYSARHINGDKADNRLENLEWAYPFPT